MKTILSLLLFPMLIFAQPNYLPQGEYVEVHFSFDLQHPNFSEMEKPNGTVDVQVTVEVFYREYSFPKSTPAKKYIPQHLNSLSLVGSYVHTDPNQSLNTLLATNDIQRPAERSSTNWLKTVPFESSTLAKAQQIPEGFGARVSQ